jgi:RimJ/RimL family protein N-acetyltransferase
MIIKTNRLILREMQQSDYPALCKILQDADVMYAYEGAFNDNEVQEWLDRQFNRYKEFGFGLWAVILSETGEMIGQCGLTMQNYLDNQVLEVGYLFQKAFWHQGYATEAAIACRDYAFDKLNADEAFSIIRDNNTASQNVATRNGMTIKDSFIKHYRGIDTPHYLFSVKRGETKI